MKTLPNFKSVKFVPKQSDSKVRHHDDLKKKKNCTRLTNHKAHIHSKLSINIMFSGVYFSF